MSNDDTRVGNLTRKSDIQALSDRLDALERRVEIIVDGFEFAANEVRPMFGQGALALIFDAIHDRLRPKKEDK